MSQIVFSRNSFLILLALWISACKTESKDSLPYFNTPDFTPIFLKSNEDVQKVIPHQIASFSFQDQFAKPISDKDIAGKIHVANFIFTSCGSICPVMTAHFKKVNDAFAKDSSVVLLSYSVTPWIDDTKRLQEYTKRNNITSKNWHFLTGKKSDIYTLARKSYFAEEDLGFTKDSTDFLHTEHFILVDKNKRIRGIYNGTLDFDIEQLIKDIYTLKQESNN